MNQQREVICPECTEAFDLEFDPAAEDEITECPECGAPLAVSYTAATDTVELIAEEDEEDDEDETEIEELDDDEEEGEEEEA